MSSKPLVEFIHLLFILLLLLVIGIEVKLEQFRLQEQQVNSFQYYENRVTSENKLLSESVEQMEKLLASYTVCDQRFKQKLQQARFKRASITNIYVAHQNGRICSEYEHHPQQLLDIDYQQSTFKITRSKTGIYLFSTNPLLKIAMIWEMSYQEMWSKCDFVPSRDIVLEYWLNNEFLVGIGSDGYELTPQDTSKLALRSLDLYKTPEGLQNPLQLRLYYRALDNILLNQQAYIRILLVSTLIILLWYYITEKISNNLGIQIRSGIKSGEFQCHFQPIVNMHDAKWLGAEALIRWYRYGEIYKFPDQFIPYAEQHQLSAEFSRVCVEQSKSLLAALSQEASPFFVSINIAPNDLNQDFVEEMINKLNGSIESNQAEFEITERGIKESALQSTHAFVKTLHNAGIKISLDDFGTGQSGLSYIKSLHFDKLKIDRSFVQAINTDSVDALILTTIIELANKLDVELVAEGVETKEQVTWLMERGVNLAQGWYFSKDLPFDEFIKKYNRQ